MFNCQTPKKGDKNSLPTRFRTPPPSSRNSSRNSTSLETLLRVKKRKRENSLILNNVFNKGKKIKFDQINEKFDN